jgi:hypothetical protein
MKHGIEILKSPEQIPAHFNVDQFDRFTRIEELDRENPTLVYHMIVAHCEEDSYFFGGFAENAWEGKKTALDF